MKTVLLFGSLLLTMSLFGQKTKTNTAKIEFANYPSLPAAGVEKLGIQVYTADLPFNKDTLRLYLDNMDLMKSDLEQVSKVDFKALNEIQVVGGEGDVTIEMAFGKATIVSKVQKKSACLVAKDGCVQYYYTVTYHLPALVQARNSEGVLNTWELESEMELQFGNEQVETHVNTEEASITSVQVITYTSEADLALAFNKTGDASLVRKGIIKQIGKLADSIYNHFFFEETTLKLDITYGNGKAADYTETETASENAVTALENEDYNSLSGPTKIWETWLERYNSEDRKAAVNKKVAQGLHENLSISYTFMHDFDKARNHLDKALAFSQTGSVNENEVRRLKRFYKFIDKQEKVVKYNSALSAEQFVVAAPDVKKLLGRRKYNKEIDFLIASDKYGEIAKNHSEGAEEKDISEMTVDEFLNQESPDPATTDSEEISLDGRVANNMLVLSGIVDGNMRGKALPNSICEYPEITVIRARNIGLTSLPDCMSQLTKLEKLYINSNSFEALPDMFAAMTSLEILDLSNNNLVSLPETVYTLTNLKTIHISGNQLSEEDMKKLKEALPNTKFK